MLKERLNDFKSMFKKENEGTVVINEVCAVYIKTNENAPQIISTKTSAYQMLDINESEKFYETAKKVISGKIDKNMFNLNFLEQSSFKDMLFDELQEGFNLEEITTNTAERVCDTFIYDKDVVVCGILLSETYMDSENFYIIVSVNKVEENKSNMVYNFIERDFQSTRVTDYSVIKMSAPVDAFLWPSFEGPTQNVSKILNYHSKSNKKNIDFITNVLNAEVIRTEKEEFDAFHNILKKISNNHIKPEKLYSIYDNFRQKFEGENDEDSKLINISIMKQVLNEENVNFFLTNGETEDTKLINAFRENLETEYYSFKYDNVIPDNTKKSVNIQSEQFEVKLTPRKLEDIQHVKDSFGVKYLLVKLDTTATIGDELFISGSRQINFEDE